MHVDVHTHVLPDRFRELLRTWQKPVRIEERDGRAFIHHRHGNFPVFAGFYDIEARIEWMDDHDIDVGLVSYPGAPNLLDTGFSESETIELAKALNDGYAALQSAHPDRFTPLGVLPLRDPEASLVELNRIIQDLDLAGVGLPTSVNGRRLSHPDLSPVFDRFDELDVSAFVHPMANCLSEDMSEREWIVNPVAVFPIDTTVQICRMVFDGFFERHSFPLVVAHLGGAIPYLVGRWEFGSRQLEDSYDRQAPGKSIYDYVEGMYFDTISFHRPALRAAIETVGTDHLLFGTDYPFPMEGVDQTIGDLESLDLDEHERRAVMGGTAAELFDI